MKEVEKKLPKPYTLKILTSLIGYGIYLPAQIIQQQLAASGIASEILIFEWLYDQEKKKIFSDSAAAYADNYKLAQLATKIPVNYQASTDPKLVEKLYQQWTQEEQTHFLCLSGLWFAILKNYHPPFAQKTIHCCRMDAGHAHTWSNHQQLTIDRSYFLFDIQHKKINYAFHIPELKNITYAERSKNVVIHGGGWGLGDFITKTAALAEAGYHRNILIKSLNKYRPEDPETSFYLNDPDWDFLNKTSSSEPFPAIGHIHQLDHISYRHQEHYHPALDLINQSKAIISKPGGMTLTDSLITGTPLIYLEPMGENEEGNAVIVDENKIGMSFEKWKDENFNLEPIRELHENIVKLQSNLPDFIATFKHDISHY
ncbi:hypothetical protein SF1_01950 [Sphingobacterium faecium NBRC 15299]|uniref:hypothetical protein n=1 Tax=Sphingobacterium faecium TaxID=34087 RepID=UPI000D3828D6|nr:hypothetical protein [Sphingobacterium faecium]PTX12504.1 hypothetical protein C8N37_102198 [Sphingobacterium faecium]GEM62213.1 hypothetical protein SF1_01950 [Sphingobacterium faecium NBRC 15299]